MSKINKSIDLLMLINDKSIDLNKIKKSVNTKMKGGSKKSSKTEYKKEWYKKNKKDVSQYNKKYYEKNKKKLEKNV